MRCETCQGKGILVTPVPVVRTPDYAKVYTESLSRLDYRPCPDCHGSGIAYCCEGTQRWSGDGTGGCHA